ncbi:unnamed protein product [Closterium sp. NIES-53]
MATPTAGRHVATTLDRASIVFKLAFALAQSVDVRITQWHATSASLAISTACASALRLLSRTGVTNDDASLSFMLDSGASQCFFRDHTSLAPLRAHVVVALADPSARSVVARSSTTLPLSASGQIAASCSCRLLTYPSLLWHHRFGHSSFPRMRPFYDILSQLRPLSALPCTPYVDQLPTVPLSSSQSRAT